MSDLVINPTIAMRRGEQHVAQCAWCGTVVVSHVRSEDLDGCPSCGRDVWWRQQLPVAGLEAAPGIPPPPPSPPAGRNPASGKVAVAPARPEPRLR